MLENEGAGASLDAEAGLPSLSWEEVALVARRRWSVSQIAGEDHSTDLVSGRVHLWEVAIREHSLGFVQQLERMIDADGNQAARWFALGTVYGSVDACWHLASMFCAGTGLGTYHGAAAALSIAASEIEAGSPVYERYSDEGAMRMLREMGLDCITSTEEVWRQIRFAFDLEARREAIGRPANRSLDGRGVVEGIVAPPNSTAPSDEEFFDGFAPEPPLKRCRT